MRHISAILWKQIKDTLKNKTILIQFLMFPMMTIIMENAIKIDKLPKHFFAILFASMFIGMAPLTAMSAIVAEEKEKNTLRVLLMSNVKPIEYLLGVGIYTFCMCMLGAVIIAVAGGYKGEILVRVLLIMALGIFISVILGALIGTTSKNQMMATSIVIPVMMIFSFIPMLAMFNETIKKIGCVFYTLQLSDMLNNVSDLKIELGQILVFVITLFVSIILFVCRMQTIKQK